MSVALGWAFVLAVVGSLVAMWLMLRRAQRRVADAEREVAEARERGERLGRLASEGNRRFVRGVTPTFVPTDPLASGEALADWLRVVRDAAGAASATYWRYEPGRGPVPYASSRGAVVPDAAGRPLEGQALAEWCSSEGLVAFDEDRGKVTLAVGPVAGAADGAPFGVLMLESPGTARADLKERLPAYGTALARVLRLVENERSVAEQQASVRNILDYATDFHKQRNPERLAEHLCERTLLLSGAGGVALVRWNLDRRAGTVVAASLGHEVEPGLAVASTSVVGEACERADVVTWRDARALSSELPVFGPGDAGRLVAALTVVPLMATRGVIGALVVEGESSRVTSKVTIGNLRLLATLVGPTLETLWDYAEVERRALTDQLTGLANRRPFESRLEHEMARLDRHEGEVSVLLVDVDFFKRVNDTYGHDVGDVVLKHVAAVLRDGARGLDLVARLGGEEFGVLLPSTGAAAARDVAERLRSDLERRPAPAPGGLSLPITASFGVATYPTAVRQREKVLKAADEALYAAKRGGRNQVVVVEGPPPAV